MAHTFMWRLWHKYCYQCSVHHTMQWVWADPFSLATTRGICKPFIDRTANAIQSMRICLSFLFLCLLRCFTSAGTRALGHPRLRSRFARPGFPIRTSSDQRLLTTSPKLFAGCYVLHRLFMSRHPPYALSCSVPLKHENVLRFQRTRFLLFVITLLNCINCQRTVRGATVDVQ